MIGPGESIDAYVETLAVLLTEMYVKGEDAGLRLDGGAGWIVPSQADRGRWYENMGIKTLRAPNVVGLHYPLLGHFGS